MSIKSKSDSMYHSALRIAALVVMAVLVFQSGLLSSVTAQMSRQTQMYLANAVGITVGVAPTELNQITAALTEKEQMLAAREAAIAAREIEVGLQSGDSGFSGDMTTLVLSVVLFILLVLIIMNYILDFMRASREVHVASHP